MRITPESRLSKEETRELLEVWQNPGMRMGGDADRREMRLSLMRKVLFPVLFQGCVRHRIEPPEWLKDAIGEGDDEE